MRKRDTGLPRGTGKGKGKMLERGKTKRTNRRQGDRGGLKQIEKRRENLSERQGEEML